ncbi:MAG: hypothetical protein V4506_00705 [Bacteroidota bacterium]
MARCNFSIEFSDTAESLIERAREGIIHAKGEFTGDVTLGTFVVPTALGNIEGRYTLEDSVITIFVADKPMLISCKRIESELRKFMV